MASIARSSLLRQTAMVSRLAVPATRSAFMPMPSIRSQLKGAAAFHNTVRRSAILPPGPQRIEGGVNDPAPIPEPNAAHGSYHWTFERLLAAGLVPLTVAPFAAGSLNPTLDAILCSVLLLHSHMGFQQVVIDYIPSRTYPGLRKLFNWLLNIATVLVGVGLYEFETNDVGITEAVRRVWKA
ncbi:mitochondrial succinate dehydrogenase subunit D [Fusarium beomiforme]|uniref:Succinate dehydrogenase [ubiquinone] cytochrome b small subunit n=1 Tax=Fusarium beomiforme TaxID=44412 RepID=A0A9P5AQP0_9HYPO|nr:mitochondrial succinate dehydrogenase subunit D [Fusarium beomiforme]